MAIEFKKGISVDGNSSITGTVSVSSVTSDNSTYTGIMVWDGGVLKYRTKSQILSDIGATSNTGTVTSVTVQGTTGLSGSGTVTTSGTITLTNSDRGSSQAIYKNIATQSGTATANSNNDTLTITGTGGTTTSRSGDTITINSTDNNDNYYVSSVSFNTGNGVLTLNRHNTTSLTVDLDGRYLELSGGTMSGSIAMGNNSITGVNEIQANGDLKLNTSTGEHAVYGAANAQTMIYHNGVKKFETASNGVSIIGNIDLTPSSSDISMIDNSGAALEVKQGSDLYMRFITTNGGEHIEVNKNMEIQGLTATSATFSSTVTVSNGQIVLNGTGRIQGVDTVSSGTDAANKTYVDNAVAGVPQGTVTSIKATTDGNSLGLSGAVTSIGTLTLPWQGSTSQYVRGDGSLSTFPAIPSVGNGTLTMTTSTGLDGGTTFTANQSGNSTFAVTLDLSEITLSAGLDAGATSLSLDLSEFTDMTAAMNTNDEFIVLDSSAERRKRAGEIGLSIFSNDSGFITSSSLPTVNNATITIAAGTNLTTGGNFTTNQGSNETITINMATGGVGAGTYGSTSNSTKIDNITVDAYGRVTGVSTGATGQVNTVSAGNANTIQVSGTTGVTVTANTGTVSSSSSNLATGAQIQTAINTAITGVLKYDGTWNASTNSPALSSGSGTVGEYYIVSVAGSTNLDGITDWAVGDWAVFSDQATDAWQKIDNTQVGNVTGSGSNTRLAVWNSNSNITSDSDFTTSGTRLIATQLAAGDGTDGYFYSDSAGRTAFTAGDFYIQSGVSNYYNYATNIYLGNTSGDNVRFRGNPLTGDNWGIAATGIMTAPGGNSQEWNAAYDNHITGISDSGSSTITITLTQNDGGTYSTSFSNPQGTTTPSNTQTFTNKSGNISQWTNNSGYITSSSLPTVNNPTVTVTTASGLDGGTSFTLNQSSNKTIALSLDLSELTDMTATMTGTDEFIVLDSGAERRKAASEIGNSIFSNTAGYITSASLPSVGNGQIDGRTSGNGLSGSMDATANQSGNTTFTVTSNATTAATASTIAYRDSSADLNVRLLRANYGDQSTISGAMAFRVNSGSDNYTRYCNSPSAIRTFIGAASSSVVSGVTSVATGNGISGGTITSTGTLTVSAGDGLSQSTTGLLVDYLGTNNIILSAPSTATGTLGTSDQILVSANSTNNIVKSTISNLPFTNNAGDITAVVAGNKLTGGGTSGSVTLGLASNNISQWSNNSGYTTNTGTVTSIKVTTNGTALGLSNSVSTSGTCTLPWAGTSTQYVTGNGALKSFPSIPAGANNATITLAAGTGLTGGGSFTVNQSGNQTITFNASGGGGTGNVSNTGTPLNDQLAVWTNSTTIEGTANLTFKSGELAVNGIVSVKESLSSVGTLYLGANSSSIYLRPKGYSTTTNEAELDVNGQWDWSAYSASSVATSGSINANQNFQAPTQDTLASVCVDPSGNVVRGSQEATWTFSKAFLNGTLSNTLISAPGAGKYIVVEESIWKVTHAGGGTSKGHKNPELIVRQVFSSSFDVVTKIPGANIDAIQNLNAAAGSGLYGRDVPAASVSARMYKPNTATTLHKNSAGSGTQMDVNIVSVSLKMKYRILSDSTF